MVGYSCVFDESGGNRWIGDVFVGCEGVGLHVSPANSSSSQCSPAKSCMPSRPIWGDSTPKYTMCLTFILSLYSDYDQIMAASKTTKGKAPAKCESPPRYSMYFPITNPLLSSRTQRCQGKSRQKSRPPRRTRAQYAQDAVFRHIPPSQDPQAPSRSQVPAEIDSACTQDGSIPDYCFVRRPPLLPVPFTKGTLVFI
jgi:hypothetical protein